MFKIYGSVRLNVLIPHFLPYFRSGDIRDQSRKLTEVAQNFGRFFGSPKFMGAGIPKIVPSLSLLPRGTSTVKVS